MKNLIKTLEQIGKSADQEFVKVTVKEVSMYFGLPLQVVKIETVPPQATFAKLGREVMNALNGAYSYAQKKIMDDGPSEDDVFTVSTDGNLEVIINGKLEIKEIGFKKAPEEEGDVESFLNHVVAAANAGCMKVQIKAFELAKNLTEK